MLEKWILITAIQDKYRLKIASLILYDHAHKYTHTQKLLKIPANLSSLIFSGFGEQDERLPCVFVARQ